ncbi:MAG: hypothetical protein HRU50_04860 [Winogradskyella sp.]|uniref:hypothetical protein n=1 Tax=Winogradskyella sp. TaxID=1883156 RepID=UPI0025D6C02F|nr:hypothetical protein [Winogradskyella sp.]NRB59257.1 hypothetical protein [Winogradskyella sp.]
MKKHFLCFGIICVLITSCIGWGLDDDVVNEDPFGPTFNYQPVTMNRAEFETTTSVESTPRTIINSGKIYVKGNYIYVNEVNKGFHIINNTDPTNPVNIGFIQVLGSSDLSIKENVFYVNNATDLLAFTLDESTETITITKRLENVFPQIWTPEGPGFYDIADNEVIIDWEFIN